ncbi:MAG: helix-turn-helix transcriptional regulator [Proteobacteria bacterium]|nr:helix-turn-helix transcriptional regulator [Pseudomonadota bacterium]
MSRPTLATGRKDPAHVRASENALEKAIGRQVRRYRRELGLTITDMCTRTGLSAGMVSKIENGNTSPSLATLRSLSTALNVPVTALFREFEEQRDATFVKAGHGLAIERHGTRAGHQYQLLGHSVHSDVSVEPYLITLKKESEVFPIFQHAGVEFIYILRGSMIYRHLNATYSLTPGDSLFFDSDAPHGPEELVDLPVRFLSVMTQSSNS